MRVSVVVPTYRRAAVLAKCLDALAAQRTPPTEILVVARREDEPTAAEVEGRDGPIRLVRIDVEDGRPGSVAALNAGVAASTGGVVCITDDDSEPHRDWITRIVAGFESDPGLGALGGRDWVSFDGVPERGQETDEVGLISGWGRLIGNHHLGIGPVREVDVLKGVNLSARGDLIRSIGFDTRLLGVTTEHHPELHLCLAIKRRGFRVAYDPAIAVDHHPAPRTAESREQGALQVHFSAHNETLALVEHLGPAGRAAHLTYATAIGSRAAPGVAQSIRLGITTGSPALDLLRANLRGRKRALATWKRHGGVLAIADSDNAATRAEQLLEGIDGARLMVPRGPRDALRAGVAALRTEASSLYLVDIGKVTAPIALLGRLRGKRVVLDTGDAVLALSRSLGDRSFLGTLLVGAGEKLAVASADRVVVRGRLHADLVHGPVTHIPDLAPPGAAPVGADALRDELDLAGTFVVGIVGSLIQSPRLGVSYGWDLIEALALTEPSVVALIVGEGSGRESLEARAHELGVFERCRFVGRIGPERINDHVAAMDAGLSTQTNDLVGRVRTTGKLPLYLSCARPVLASHVGEAGRLLGPLGWTIPFDGRLDRRFPSRLADRIETWRQDPEGASERRRLASSLAASEFDPATMRARLRAALEV
jgi:GT2 family glycosyltransferase/glycosyltransferase involved in cell wall biosynthesis